MRKASTNKASDDDMRAEYRREDLGPLVRGKYYQGNASVHLVSLRPEIHKAFPSSEAVNDALAGLIAIAEQAKQLTTKPKRAAKKRATA